MDKRSILFIICVTASFFLLNLFFTHQDQQRKQEWIEQQRAHQEKEFQLHQEEIARRTVDLDSLPVINVFADRDKTEFETVGVFSDNLLLTISWRPQLPNVVYVASDENAPSKKMTLLKENETNRGALYSTGNYQPMKIGYLYEIGKFDIQLVGFEKDESGVHPKVFLGEYEGGHLFLAGEGPQTDALAFIKEGSSYLPVGIYNFDTKEIDSLDQMEAFKGHIAKRPVTPETPASKSIEKFYVLEDDYQQIVFSNRGGAIAEINLPFLSDKNEKSVVRSIHIDDEMVTQDPENAHFPSQSYYTPGATADAPNENVVGQLGGYYPLLRRDLISGNGVKVSTVLPRYYALNIVSEYPEVAEMIYKLKSFQKDQIVFEAEQPHRRITKTYRLDPSVPYTFTLDIKVEGDARGLWLTTGVPDVELVSGSAAPALKYRITRNQKGEVENLTLPKSNIIDSTSVPDWICNSNGFFGVILDPLTPVDSGYMAQFVPGTALPTRLVDLDKQHEHYKSSDYPGYNMMLPLKKQGGTMQFRIYAGPFDEKTLKAVDAKFTDPATGDNPDYIACQSFHGWFAFISAPFAKFLMILMNFFYSLTHSWGFSIILLTVVLRILLYPLNSWSFKSMRKMQEIAPEITKINEKYKKDPKKAQVEIMNLYRSKGVNPLSGCFPLLIQLPFLIGMFDLLKSSFELRGAPFIPGWIDNLAAPDVLFRWSTPIPLIGNEFHLLPILLGVVMFLQQKLMTPAVDPKAMTDAQRQQRAMGTLMPILFTVMFYQFASGLNIYWLSSMILGVIQQWWTNRGLKTPEQPKPAR